MLISGRVPVQNLDGRQGSVFKKFAALVHVHVCVCMCMYVQTVHMYVYVSICMYLYVYVCVWMGLYVYECVISLKPVYRPSKGVFIKLEEVGISALGGERVKSFFFETYIAPLQDTTTQRRSQPSHGQSS